MSLVPQSHLWRQRHIALGLTATVVATACARVFWYHGVTPPALWGTNRDRDFLERSEVGAELAWCAHLAVADSPFGAAELGRLSGYPDPRIRVVPIGIDTASFLAKPPAKVLSKLGAKWNVSDKRVLLYIGRVAGNKRIDLLIDALSLLANEYPDLCLMVVGDDSSTAAYRELADKLRKQAQDLGLASRVRFTGKVPEVKSYYHLADLFILPSQHEGFGVPLVEAMAAGVPVVASASGAMPWVLNAQQGPDLAAGLVFPPGNAPELAGKIRTLLDDGATRRRLIERGFERAASFGKERFAAEATRLVAEAEEMAQHGDLPTLDEAPNSLIPRADVALRSYRVRSQVPVLGPLIEWIRVNLTTHVKEAYVDRIIERQVLYNRAAAREIQRLRSELAILQARLDSLEGAEEQTHQDRLDSVD